MLGFGPIDLGVKLDRLDIRLSSCSVPSMITALASQRTCLLSLTAAYILYSHPDRFILFDWHAVLRALNFLERIKVLDRPRLLACLLRLLPDTQLLLGCG